MPTLARNPSVRPAPAILAAPPLPSPDPRKNSLASSHGSSAHAHATGVTAGRPDPRVWQAMGEAERAAWLKTAQKDARTRGETFLNFAAQR